MCDICHNVIMFVVLLEIQCSRRDVSKHSSDVIFPRVCLVTYSTQQLEPGPFSKFIDRGNYGVSPLLTINWLRRVVRY